MTITRTFRLLKDRDALDLAFSFELPKDASSDRSIRYRLHGPSGIPIEGEWYSTNLRNAYFASADGNLITHSANDIVNETPEDELEAQRKPGYVWSSSAGSLAFSGVENQYFATFLKPEPSSENLRSDAVMTVIDADPNKKRSADVSVDVTFPKLEVTPARPVTDRFVLYAGPKTDEALAAFGAEDLATFRRAGSIRIWILGPIIRLFIGIYEGLFNPAVEFLSYWVVGPLLERSYAATAWIAGLFGGTRGSYGIAIIILTIIVRLAMFPISRKQAISAKKTQLLKPEMDKLREKFKDDPQRMQSENFKLMREYGVNPFAGCLPMFLQIPIFMTLWRTLNIRLELRQAEFLWIDNLAAPDMLFKLPFTIPVLGEYFNLLPLLVIGLMQLQMKLFTPPAQTSEQETQQKTMRVMMIGMMLFFYRVPAGLALYFITSSLWAVGERLLLPKVVLVPKRREGGEPGDANGTSPAGGPKPGGGGWFSRKIEELMKEAERQRMLRDGMPNQRSEAQSTSLRKRPAPTASTPPQERRNPKKRGKTKPGKRR